ncbi:hypothetical protein RFI_37293, partial [Reticulomyxa filosa]
MILVKCEVKGRKRNEQSVCKDQQDYFENGYHLSANRKKSKDDIIVRDIAKSILTKKLIYNVQEYLGDDTPIKNVIFDKNSICINESRKSRRRRSTHSKKQMFLFKSPVDSLVVFDKLLEMRFKQKYYHTETMDDAHF